MDKEYLQHIEGSPYINEALPARLKSYGAGLQQKLSGMGGSSPFQSIDYTKLTNRYNTFIEELKSVLKDFSQGQGSVAERLKAMKHPPLSKNQLKLVDKLTNLYSEIVPSAFPPGYDVSGRGHLTQQGLLNPPNISLQQAMKHAIKEGWKEMMTRRLGLNKALASNDANAIINEYIKVIKETYNDFINDVSKIIPNVSKQDVSKIFKNIVNDPKASQTLNKIKQVAGPLSVSAPTAIPPVISPTAVPPVISPDKTPTQSGEEKTSADDFVKLVAAVINIITTKVHDDPTSHPYFSKPLHGGEYYLPKQIEEPSPTEPNWAEPQKPKDPNDIGGAQKYATKMASYPYTHITGSKGEPTGYVYNPSKGTPQPVPGVPKITEAGDEESDMGPTDDAELPKRGKEDKGDIDLSGEFVYDFASLYHKYPGKFTIEVTDGTGYEITLSGGKSKIIRVFWAWNKHENTIIIKYRNKDENTWKQSNLLKFYDDQVNPLSPNYDVNIPLFLKQSDPRAEELYKKATPTSYSAITEAIKPFKPALYAVIRRKGPMEFKSHKDLKIYIRPEFKNKESGGGIPNPYYGSVEILRGKGYKRNTVVSMRKLKDYYYSKDQKEQDEWREAMEDVGYFNEYPDLKKEFSNEPVKTDVKDIPNAVDAVKGLEALQFKKSDALNAVQQVVDTYGTDLSVEDYTKKALANGKTKVEPESPTTQLPPEKDKDIQFPTIIPSQLKKITDILYYKKETGDLYLFKSDGSFDQTVPAKKVPFLSDKIKNTLKQAGYPENLLLPHPEKPEETKTFGVKKINEDFINPFQKTNLL